MFSEVLKKLADKNADAFHHAPVTIGFLGDSVTNGCFEVLPALTDHGEEGIDVVFDPENSYSAHFRRMLLNLYPKAQINIINAGISGDSAPVGLERMDRDLLPYHPDLTVVCYGLNDCGDGLGGVEKYGERIREIITRLQQAGSDVVFLSPCMMATHVSCHLTQPKLREVAESCAKRENDGVVQAYFKEACRVGTECGALVCDCYSKWKKLQSLGVDTTSLLANYINHPSRDMHKFMAWSLTETVFFQS